MGLVHDCHSDLAERIGVLAGVVSAEEQLAAALELHPKVGLSSAAVTAVGRGERGGTGGNGSSHIGLFPLSGERVIWFVSFVFIGTSST